ncbi:MAG: hypothetical protein GQ564_19905 [Bacteroidales bacterium]|nr:hypothetical protein [Bacteroidales bacterium]
MDRIILCDSKDHAYQLSKDIWEKESYTVMNRDSSGAERMFGIDENFLTEQFGLHVPLKYWGKLPVKYKTNIQNKTPLWVNEEFINGEPFFALGVGQFGFANVNPIENRKILQGNYSPEIIAEARNTTRIYTTIIQNRATRIINDILSKPINAAKLLETLDPYVFEELIAELLVDKGFDIYLTKGSGDGGKDIMAAYTFDDEPVLMMVECKRRKHSSTFGPAEVRALIGQYFMDKGEKNITHLALMTTSNSIGPEALRMEEKLDELSIKNCQGILDWIKGYGQIKNGLWMPEKFNEII